MGGLPLDNQEIFYEREKRFETLKSTKNSRYNLRYDFYLPTFNVLLEFDGEQHFSPRDHWGGQKAFERLQENDRKKNDWASESGLRLIRISFDQSEYLEDILTQEILSK